MIWLLFQMLLTEKAEALQEEVELLLKVPTDIPETSWPIQSLKKKIMNSNIWMF